MRVTYKTRDGVELTGDTPAAVIESLRQHSHDKRRTLRAFMRVTALFAEKQTGFAHPSDTCEELLAALVHAGLIVPHLNGE
jgi:hypothetical protein